LTYGVPNTLRRLARVVETRVASFSCSLASSQPRQMLIQQRANYETEFIVG
jgi:hypothetical protein